MIADTIAMTIPEHLRAEFDAKTVYRIGVNLYRKGQPGIIAHLTEAGGLRDVALQALSSPSVPGAASPGGAGIGLLNAAMNAYQIRQGHEIRAAISTMQSLQLAELALTGVGIGVSIAGFAVLSRKIDRVAAQIAAVDDRLARIEAGVAALARRLLVERLTQLQTAVEQVDEGWLLPDPVPQWRDAARSLHEVQRLFAQWLREAVAAGALDTIEPLLDGFAMAGSTRVTSRLAAGDDAAARDAGVRFAREFEAIMGPVGAAGFLKAQLRADGLSESSPRYAAEAEQRTPAAIKRAARLRDQEAVAASTPLLLDHLQRTGQSGRSLLERARSEADSPVLILPIEGR